jgi:serine/threonine protein kinase/tetratricopeptide (TPR) repeat protein
MTSQLNQQRPHAGGLPPPSDTLHCPKCLEANPVCSLGARIARCRVCQRVFIQPRGAVVPRIIPPEDEAFLPLALGAVLRQRYKLVDLLGAGAHGYTYLAEHLFLDHPCVVKVLPGRFDQPSDGAVRRLRSEASAGFLLSHPNVVRVLDCDAVDGLWYFVMEYIDGVNLSDVLRAAGPLCWEQVHAAALDTARALDAIHRHGLLHRDVKPGNLIQAVDGSVRVSDLGVVGWMSGPAAATQPEAGVPAGTIGYAAPEAFSGGSVGPQADLYSLGATLFELLTGRLPHGPSIYHTLLAAQDEPAAWPSAAAPDVPEWLVRIVLRLLECGPAQRFDSARTVIDALERRGEPGRGAASAASAERSEPRGLVVLALENRSGAGRDDWLGHALADHLSRALSRCPQVYVVDRDQFQQVLDRVKQRSARTAGEQLLEAGRVSGAATVVQGWFRRDGETLNLGARVFRSGTAEPMELTPLNGPLTALGDLEAALFGELTARLGLTAAGTPPVVSSKRAYLRGDYETAQRLAAEAFELDPEYGEAIGFVGVCAARMGQYEQAQACNRHQQELAVRMGDERLSAEAFSNLGTMHYFRGDYLEANEALTKAVQVADSLGLTTDAALIRNNLGFVLLQLGRQGEAEEMFRRAIETHKRYGALVSLIGPYNGIGHVLREQGRHEEAREHFARALALARESDDYVNMGVAYMNLGHCALLAGQADEAKTELAIALNILEQTSFWNGLARVYEHMAELNLKLARWDEAVRCADMRIELAQRHSNVQMEAAAWKQKGEALRQSGRSAEAEACLARAVCDTGAQ